MYPMLAYNIGLNKMILQNSLGEGEQYVFTLPKNHHFLNFVKYNSFKDMDFNNAEIDTNCSCFFVFLTIDTTEDDKMKKEPISINIIFVDIFDVKPKFKHVQSKKKFGH